MESRLQKLEALLGRVRQRASLARGAAPAPVVATPTAPPRMAPPPEPVPEASIPTAPPPAVSLQPAARSLPVQAPESGWPDAPSQPAAAVLEVVDNPPLETLGEEDLLEIPSDMLESVPPSGGVHAREDEPPASSQRPKAEHLDDLEQASAALASEEDGREVPLKTPPPESGPQAAPPPGMGAPPLPQVDQLLEADLMPPPPVAASAEPLPTPFDSLEQPFGSRPPPPASGPTVEQLGQTIELEEARGPELELDWPMPTATPLPLDELEEPLPPQAAAGGYDEALMPPPEAQQELSAHQDSYAEPPPVVPLQSAMPEVAFAPAVPLHTMPAAGEFPSEASVQPGVASLSELVQRPPVATDNVVQISAVATPPAPRTFLQLLDASIALGG
ncbi:MAG: hypothetical protein QM756_20775 [Polyangiaceae bacterium]